MQVHSGAILSSQLLEDSEDHEIADRLMFERRQKEYRFLADEQIKAILTAMSISHAKKGIAHSPHIWRHNFESDKEISEDQISVTLRSLSVVEERDENKLFINAFIEGVKNL